MDDQKPQSIGALWAKENEYGTYWTGKIKVGDQEIGIVMYANTKKTADKQPDLRIFEMRKRELQSADIDELIQ